MSLWWFFFILLVAAFDAFAVDAILKMRHDITLIRGALVTAQMPPQPAAVPPQPAAVPPQPAAEKRKA
jgi:hypothetical protein